MSRSIAPISLPFVPANDASPVVAPMVDEAKPPSKRALVGCFLLFLLLTLVT